MDFHKFATYIIIVGMVLSLVAGNYYYLETVSYARDLQDAKYREAVQRTNYGRYTDEQYKVIELIKDAREVRISFLWGGSVSLIIGFGLLISLPKNLVSKTHRKCPFCSGKIALEAKLCPFCGKDVDIFS